MKEKKTNGMKAQIIELCKKSKLLVRIYEYNPRVTKFIRFGKIAPNIYVVNHYKRLVYFPIAKVANSSIRYSMCEQELQNIQRYQEIHKQVTGGEILSEEEKNYYKFTFVRNPYERLVSCYVDKYIKDRKGLGVVRKRLYMDKYLFGYIKNPKDFTDFIKKIYWIPTRLEDNHFQKQYYLLYDKNGKCLVDYVGKYENLQGDYEYIRTKFDLKPLPHYNKTEKGNWMDYYTLETAELVYKKYRKDFDVFGYNDVHDELIAYLKNKNS